ncbi:MAG: penicillin acylase family protein [Bacteroidetes bacterium]|nr:MAG: penicillin acylase family protein [Bacteroidota bacterium]
MDLYKKLIALIITIFCLAIAFFLFLKYIANVSIPNEFEENQTYDINSQVNVYRNQYGIPHIITENENDLFFAEGYIHAQDRLWQMDYLRRIGRGQLSEIFGDALIKTDKFMRAVGIWKTAIDIQKYMNKATLKLLQSYSEGINYFIEKNKNKLPYEFCALDYTPYQWTPLDCIIIQRVIALELSESFWADLTMGAVAEKLGPIRTLELLPSYPDNASCVLDSAYPAKQEKKKKDTTAVNSILSNVDNINYSKEINEIRSKLHFEGNSKGSNVWAIRKSKKTMSGAVIANDSHLPLGLPCQWEQIHLTCPSINVVGMSIPGIPFLFTGRNSSIAWGFSNMNLDDSDFFIEKIDADTNYYYNPFGNKIRFNYVKDTIKVQGKGDYVYYRKYSQRSAVLNVFDDIQNPYKLIKKDFSQKKNKFFRKYCITFNWTGSKQSNELDVLYKLNKAKNWQQFKESVSAWGVPAVNFVYGDKYGNIGLKPGGIIPQREKECKSQIPNPGWMPGFDWLGFKAINDYPYLYNPIKKFVSAANNKLLRYSQDFLSSYWEPSSRIQRIDNLLNLYDEYNSREAEIMQLDIYSTYAKDLLNYTIPLIQQNPEKLNELERQSLRRLKKWDYLMSQHTASPMIFSQFLIRLLKNTFEDEIGEKFYNEFISSSNVPTRRLLELISDSISSSWFDNVKTPNYEDKDYIVQKSFKEAINDLKELYYTEDINQWKFGKNNILKLNHILSSNELIKPAINLEPFETNGSNTTINTMEWNLSEPYKIVSGPSMRFIADMNDTVVYTSIAGGISGDPFSPHYSNQVQIWLNGGYIPLTVSTSPGGTFKLCTVFKPSK